MKVMVTASGFLTDLTVGPYTRAITEDHAEDSGDCEGRVGEVVVVVG